MSGVPTARGRDEPRRAVVIGGGISGLGCAFDLARAGWSVEVNEASPRWGGKVYTSPVGDRPVDAGPDTFLARVAPGRQLCRDLGLEAELTSPVAPVPAYIARAGELFPLPSGSMLGVPIDLDALTQSGLISAPGVARAAEDLDLGRSALLDGSDPSVGAICRERVGDEVTEWLIDPILGGINASDLDRLSLAAGAPLLASALDRSPSLMRGLAALQPSSGPTLGTGAPAQPVFFGLPGGIARIIDELVAALRALGAEVRLDSAIDGPAALADVRDRADAVVLATPAAPTAGLLADANPTAAAELRGIDYASVAQVTVELPMNGVERVLDASGVLMPRPEGRLLTAATWFSTKWAHYQREDRVLIRMTSGRYGDDRPATLDDAALTERLIADLASVIPVRAEPTAVRVHRWQDALPQYTPGHAERIARIDDALTDTPDISLVGAAYRGIGLPACIDRARGTAREIVTRAGSAASA